jgi:hypothetical protein
MNWNFKHIIFAPGSTWQKYINYLQVDHSVLVTKRKSGCMNIYLASNVAGQPVQTLVQTLTSCGTSALDVPVSNDTVIRTK